MIFVVLGMHKSGTTMLSKILHDSGIAMGDSFNDQVTYEEGNQYERLSTWKFNEEILDCEGQNSAVIKPPASTKLSLDQENRINSLINSASKQNHWGFKDPRTCLTYTMWEKYLGEHKLIIIYRHPYASWHRYRSRKRIWKNPIEAYLFLKSWKIHNTAILDILNATPCESFVVEYNLFNKNPEYFNQLEIFVDKTLVDSRFDGIKKLNYPVFSLLRIMDVIQSTIGMQNITHIMTELDRHTVFKAKDI